MPKCLSALNDLRQDGLDAIGWDGEPDAIGRRVELWIDGCQRRNADHVALQVHQRSSTIARVNRRIGLNGIVDGSSALPFGDGSFQGAHDAVGHCLRNAQGIPDDKHLLPHLPTNCATRWCAASATESECTGRYQGCWKPLCTPDLSLPPGLNSERKGGV